MNLIASIATPLNVIITVTAVLAAYLVLQRSKKTSSISAKVFLIYAHIALLLVPVAAIAYSGGCAMTPCTTQTLLFAAPFILAGVLVGAGLLGYFLLPKWYGRRFGTLPADKRMRQFVASHAKKYGLNPSVHLLDTASPVAFSFRSWKPAIFISVGLMDLLTPKEVEAVLLHELGHLVHKSSLLTFATKLTQRISPVAFFAKLQATQDEEQYADAFAA
ncbi:M48 family metalloprotease, partial [Candidatus Woesearchaeota archaeon]|nr:M48 family metalloprotease [Candidatus Woesearchaeota archaeon]